jgi:N-acetylmuramoyl-L-alanine amidase
VSTLRETEALRRHSSHLHHHRLVIGHFGGMAPLVRTVARLLRQRGADVITLDDPDARTQAQAANRFEAEVFLGLEAHRAPHCEIAYYSVPTYTSPGGESLARRLASHLDDHVSPVHGVVEVVGLRLPILRETRMSAVMLTMGPVRDVVDQAPKVATMLADSIEEWLRSPQNHPPQA